MSRKAKTIFITISVILIAALLLFFYGYHVFRKIERSEVRNMVILSSALKYYIRENSGQFPSNLQALIDSENIKISGNDEYYDYTTKMPIIISDAYDFRTEIELNPGFLTKQGRTSIYNFDSYIIKYGINAIDFEIVENKSELIHRLCR